MERVLSVEEKIRRAEEIDAKKKGQNKNITSINVQNKEKKDIKLLKKMIVQILICSIIYLTIYTVKNKNYIFSEDFMAEVEEVISYDTNFIEIYNLIKEAISSFTVKDQNKQNQNNNLEVNAIGGAVEKDLQENTIDISEPLELSQTEQDIINVKNTTTFIKPIEGIITSKFGNRDTVLPNVPKNHTGTDIAANLGTKIKSATDGEVVISSEEGDYGKHLKIQLGEVSIIYAHCNNLYVKQGEFVTQGQEIAEVGSTGNSTGPHLHFEIRYQERKVDPESILEL